MLEINLDRSLRLRENMYLLYIRLTAPLYGQQSLMEGLDIHKVLPNYWYHVYNLKLVGAEQKT